MAIFYRQTGALQKLLCLDGPVVATDQRRAVNQRFDGSSSCVISSSGITSLSI